MQDKDKIMVNYTNDKNNDVDKTQAASMMGCLVDTCKIIAVVAMVGFCAYLFYTKDTNKNDKNAESVNKMINTKDSLGVRDTVNVIQYNQKNVKALQR